MILARIFRHLSGLVFVMVLALGMAVPAKADIADKVFDLLKSKGDLVGINPDGVEMARYLARYPENGSKVLAFAAEQDYPFFGLVGAVKAAKNKTFPKIGVFTEEKCLFPITAVDDVFAKGDSMISNAGGKQKTTDVVSYAKNYAKNYALAQTAEAKESFKKELAEKVPYFNDIPLICHFGFHTDFKMEHDIQNLITAKVKQAKDIYHAFKSGDIEQGASLLISLGLSTEMVCDIVDGALVGTGVGAIPGVSALSNGLCKSFVGKVIGKAISKGVGAVKAAACEVYDWFGGSCNTEVPVAKTGYSNGLAFCASNGGIKSLLSKTNAQDDYSVICNNGMRCIAKPGAPPQCTTLAQAEELLKKHAEDLETLFASGLKNYSDNFKSKNIEPCWDAQCKGAMGLLLLGYTVQLKKLHEQDREELVGILQTKFSKEEFESVKKINEEAAQRKKDMAANTSGAATDQLHAADCKNFLGRADEYLCEQMTAFKSCVERVKKGQAMLCFGPNVAYGNPEKVNASLASQACKPATPGSTEFACQTSKGKDVCERFVSGGTAIKCAVSTDAAAAEQLHGLACKNFLGRADEYLCTDSAAFQLCVESVKKGQAKLCLAGDRSYGEPGKVVALLANQGCKSTGPHGAEFICESEKAKTVCARFITGGMPVTCELGKASGAIIGGAVGAGAAPAADECRNFLGRADQFLCTTEAGFQACLGKVKAKQASLCFGPNKSYGDPNTVIKILAQQSCQSGGANGAIFACKTPQGQSSCQKFLAGGLPLTCNLAP